VLIAKMAIFMTKAEALMMGPDSSYTVGNNNKNP
jgi:hypothetical protein